MDSENPIGTPRLYEALDMRVEYAVNRWASQRGSEHHAVTLTWLALPA